MPTILFGYSANIAPNGGGYGGALTGINNAGDTLGVHLEHADSSYPLINDRPIDGRFFWPTLPGVHLTNVFAINNAGQILVAGDPVPQVPEPEMYATLIAGLALVNLVIRQRRGKLSGVQV